MPRPELAPELIAAWEADLDQAEKNPPPGMEHLYANPIIRNKLREVSLAGRWLKTQLEAASVDEEKVKKLSFAFGQRCMLAPDVWDLAEKTFEIFKKGQITNPSEVYATRDFPDEERQAIFDFFTKVHAD